VVSEERKVRWEQRDNVAWMVIDSPETRNALSVEVIRDTVRSLEEIDEHDDIGAVCVRGEGDVAFCAGMNLKDLGRLNPDRPPLQVELMHDAIRHFPKPVIAAVNGYCVGGGMSLLANCDLAIASDRAVFGLPEVIRGGPPGRAIGELMQTIPTKFAMELILSGRNWDANRAMQVGLLNRVVPHDELESAAQEWAADIASFPHNALANTKMIVHRINDILPHDERVNANTDAMRELRDQGDQGMFGDAEKSALSFLGKKTGTKASWDS